MSNSQHISTRTSEKWKEDGLCNQTDPEAFYPEKGEGTSVAKKVCVGCPVRAECLDFALRTDEDYGVWGGLSARERRALVKAAVKRRRGEAA